MCQILIYCVQSALNGFKGKLRSKFDEIRTHANTHTHICTPMACALTQTALPKLIYPPTLSFDAPIKTRDTKKSILDASQEEYNETAAWVNQLFANETLDASETGKTF